MRFFCVYYIPLLLERLYTFLTLFHYYILLLCYPPPLLAFLYSLAQCQLYCTPSSQSSSSLFCLDLHFYWLCRKCEVSSSLGGSINAHCVSCLLQLINFFIFFYETFLFCYLERAVCTSRNAAVQFIHHSRCCSLFAAFFLLFNTSLETEPRISVDSGTL